MQLYSSNSIGEKEMLSRITEVVSQSGIWSEGRRESHSFLLSPSVYCLNEGQKLELEALGFALQKCLLGLSQIAIIACDPLLNYRGAWRTIRQVFSTGVPSRHKALQGLNVRDIPKLLKVDLMVDQEGNFKIAEIDGHNKHGIGYSTIAMRVRNVLCPDSRVLPGVVRSIIREMEAMGEKKLKLFYGDHERFYLPEFLIAKQEFEKLGVECQVVGEMDVDPEFLESGLFLDLPFLNQRVALCNLLSAAYRVGKARFIIPPKPFFGAKGVLALLRNDYRNEQMEAVLHAFIDKASLELVRRHIPETWLVGQETKVLGAREISPEKRYVLKESISSGMKGVFFSDESDFKRRLEIANEQNMNWILQEEVENLPQAFSWFEGNDSSPRTADDWFMRVTAHYVARELADVVVTATQNRAVHGGKRCLQLGTVIGEPPVVANTEQN